MAKTDKEADKPQLFKDFLNRASVSRIADAINRVYPKFEREAFVEATVTDRFLKLELKDRMSAVAIGLKPFLPDNFAKATRLFEKAAPNLNGFENWALMTFIEQFGLNHLEDSIAAMKALTQFSSAESAIRPFIIRYPERMLAAMNEWTSDSNEHVRRLAAEGSRPRGVWTLHIDAFKKDPAPVLEILEKLKADPSLYVRKAVANNLNDISKDHPDIVIKTALRWQKDGNRDTDWIIKHACRSLIKKGHPEVFPIFGFTLSPKLQVKRLTIAAKKIKIGGESKLEIELKSLAKKTQKLAIDYILTYVKKGGKKSPKVFKVAEKSIRADESLKISRKLSFQDQSIRTHHPGQHTLQLVINGQIFGSVEFTLTK